MPKSNENEHIGQKKIHHNTDTEKKIDYRNDSHKHHKSIQSSSERCTKVPSEKYVKSSSGKRTKVPSEKRTKPIKSDETPIEIRRADMCFDKDPKREHVPCIEANWQGGKYVKDECGSGIVPELLNWKMMRNVWCKIPLSTYQSTIGELGRKILCQETLLPRDIKPEPPCNIREYILPLCGGYYSKYDCLRPCEEQHVRIKGDKKIFRDRVKRYWEPCLSKEERFKDINLYAPSSMALSNLHRRRTADINCW